MSIPKPKYELSEEYRQLALGLELPEVELEHVSFEEARLRSEAGRAALAALKGTHEQPGWYERFEALINAGWPWRQATYIAWASMPKEGREPKSQDDLAKGYLNLTSDRAINTWRKKNPAIDAAVAVLQSAELWDHRADSFKNLVAGMKQAGSDYKFFNHLKLALEMTGDYVPLSQLAAVVKRKGSGGVTETNEDVLNDLAAGAEELEGMISPHPYPLNGDFPPALSPSGNAPDGEREPMSEEDEDASGGD
jgi:hypothetical protein